MQIWQHWSFPGRSHSTDFFSYKTEKKIPCKSKSSVVRFLKLKIQRRFFFIFYFFCKTSVYFEMPFHFLWNKIENIFLNLNFKIEQFIWGSNKTSHLSGQEVFYSLELLMNQKNAFFPQRRYWCCVEAALIFDIYYLNLICALALPGIMASSLPDVRSLNALLLNSAGMQDHFRIPSVAGINRAIMKGRPHCHGCWSGGLKIRERTLVTES